MGEPLWVGSGVPDNLDLEGHGLAAALPSREAGENAAHQIPKSKGFNWRLRPSPRSMGVKMGVDARFPE